MKGDGRVINALNDLLAEELTAINQYMVHSEMCADWRYEKLHEAAEKRAIEEMHHAEKLIGRILFLEGVPVVSNLNKINIGAAVENQHRNDLGLEAGAIASYNSAIHLCTEAADHGTSELLRDILKEEEEHLDWLDAQLVQIEQIGISSYLVVQID